MTNTTNYSWNTTKQTRWKDMNTPTNITTIRSYLNNLPQDPFKKKNPLKMFFRPILPMRKENWERWRTFVSILATWCLDETNNVFKMPLWIFSRTRWQPISICFVNSWKIGFSAMCIVDWLSEKSNVGKLWISCSP